MQNDRTIIDCRPNHTTLIKKDGKLYYCFRRGIGMAYMDKEENSLICKMGDVQMWGAFHFSIEFSDRIVFIPKDISYLYYVSPDDKKVDMVLLEKEKETLIPFMSDKKLFLYGTQSQTIFCVDSFMNVSVVEKGKGEACWKYNGAETNDYLCMWDEKRKQIGIIEKATAKVRLLDFGEDSILCVGIKKNNIYVLGAAGKLYCLGMNDGCVQSVISTGANGEYKTIYNYGNKLFLLPEVGDKVFVISENQDVRSETLNCDLLGRQLFWSKISEDVAICMAQHAKDPWNYKMYLFEYSLRDGTIYEYPFDRIIARSLLHENKGGSRYYQETNIFDLNDFISL